MLVRAVEQEELVETVAVDQPLQAPVHRRRRTAAAAVAEREVTGSNVGLQKGLV